MDEEFIKISKEEPKEQFIPVKIITRGEKMSLVETFTDGVPSRFTIPTKDIKENQITLSVSKKGIPFGIPYETLDFPKLSAQDISNIFKHHGFWTPEDFRTKPMEVQSVLIAIAGKYYSVLLDYIRNK